jgi:hypothetical protein
MVEIEILYFDGCPNHGPAVQAVEAVLKDEGIGATISEVNIRDAEFARDLSFSRFTEHPREWAGCRA